MKPCSRVGIDVTKKCNWRCRTCFYRYREDFNTNFHKSPDIAKQEILDGKAGGCTGVIIIGWGEPMLYPHLEELLEFSVSEGMSFSIITNGTGDIKKYISLYKKGIDHFHVSVHGVGDVLNKIAGGRVSKKQRQFLYWLMNGGIPWRSNTTVQKENYKQLPEIAKYCVENDCRHFVSLGFLPHYEWKNRLKEVAVHPAELKPYIQEALDVVFDYEGLDAYATIRYQPMCHLDPKYWKYVVNARYVPYDPFEWCYNGVWPNASEDEVWRNALRLGNSVAVCGEPCRRCKLLLHCGGWNKTYAKEFDGAGLKAVEHLPAEYASSEGRPGYIHDMNPVNSLNGRIE